jgi:hypothetical protein
MWKCVQSNLLATMGVDYMVNINVVIEGHSRDMYVCERKTNLLQINGIY